MAQGHCVRSVAIVPGVPEVEDPVVPHQDIATLANLAVPGLRSGSGKDRIVRDRFLIHQAERGLLRPGRLRLCWRENGEPEGHGYKGCAQKRKSICDHGSFVPDWLSHVGEPKASVWSVLNRSHAFHFSLRRSIFDVTLMKNDPPAGAVAQLGERSVRNAEVEGSIPFRSTKP